MQNTGVCSTLLLRAPGSSLLCSSGGKGAKAGSDSGTTAAALAAPAGVDAVGVDGGRIPSSSSSSSWGCSCCNGGGGACSTACSTACSSPDLFRALRRRNILSGRTSSKEAYIIPFFGSLPN